MEEKHLVVIPLRARMVLFKYCDERKIEYKVVAQKYFPDGTPGGCTFRGVSHITGVVGFESILTKDEVYNILEEMLPKHIKFDHVTDDTPFLAKDN